MEFLLELLNTYLKSHEQCRDRFMKQFYASRIYLIVSEIHRLKGETYSLTYFKKDYKNL